MYVVGRREIFFGLCVIIFSRKKKKKQFNYALELSVCFRSSYRQHRCTVAFFKDT